MKVITAGQNVDAGRSRAPAGDAVAAVCCCHCQATHAEARAVLEPAPVSWYNFRHARSSRPAILREEEAGFHARLHEDGSITWERYVTRPDGTVEES
jgi:hypothetical protein